MAPSLRAAALYAFLTVLLTWPLAANLRIMDAGDSAFFAWEIGWERHALGTHPGELAHANIFHPLRHALGLDEPILGTTALVLPVGLFTDDAVLLHNLARLLTFVLSGLAAFWLARELGAPPGPALFTGAAFAFSPIRTDQIAHLSTLGTQWLPLVVLFAVRFARTGRIAHALLAALFFVLSFHACGYHGVIALAVMPPAFLVLFAGRWKRLGGATLAAALAGLALLPLYSLHRAALAPERYERGFAETTYYSAALESFLATSPWNRLYGDATDPFRTIGPNNLFPGLLLPVLVVTASIGLWRRHEKPSAEAVSLAVMALLAVVVALGPRLRVFGHDLGPAPFAVLREAVPVFRMIRVTSRAGVFLALPLAALAGLALTRGRLRRPWLVVAFMLALGEGIVAPIPMPEWTQVIDSSRPTPEVDRWLAAQPPGTPIVQLPMRDVHGLEQRPAFHESVYMVRSTRHWQPMVNGYAGIEPRDYRRYRELGNRFPSDEFIDAMRTIGVRYVVVHRGGFGPNQWARLEEGLPAFVGRTLREAATFEDAVVFEIRPAAGTETPRDR
jgi:hypothetical protein